MGDDAKTKLKPIYVTKLLNLSFQQFYSMKEIVQIGKKDWHELERFWKWNKMYRRNLQDIMDLTSIDYKKEIQKQSNKLFTNHETKKQNGKKKHRKMTNRMNVCLYRFATNITL